MSEEKTTPEDLDKTIAEAEQLSKEPVKEEEEVVPEEQSPESEDEVVVPPEEEEKETKDDEEPEKEQSPDYKKKFSESAKNAQKVVAKNRKINEAIDEQIPEPTDVEMKSEFPDWEAMDSSMQQLAKEAVMNRRFRTNLQKAREEGKKIEKWNDSVQEFVENPETLTKHPDLEGRLEEFREFSTAESNVGASFDLLIPAFLHNSKAPTKNKGGMFPKGSAGDKEKQKPSKLTVEQGRQLRSTDYAKWKRYLKAGKIDQI